ncbi:MAG: polysaccharide pyruvyl transferase family protein [Candidatus Jordarchaeaceae archaeon]
MKKSPKILIILVHSTQNAGDLALLEVSIYLLKRNFPDVEFIISANYPNEAWYKIHDYQVVPSPTYLVGKSQKDPSLLQLVKFFLGWIFALMFKLNLLNNKVPENWRQLFEAYETCDLVVAVPGNQFFSTGRLGWPFPATLMGVALAHLFNKPLYVLPQSIGPFHRWWEKKFIRWAYSRANLVLLRDQISLEIARAIGLPKDKVSYAPDPAFALLPAPREQACEILKSFGWDPHLPSLGVTVIAPLGRSLNQKLVKNYYRVLLEALLRFALGHNLQVVFFTQVTGPTTLEDDRIPTLSLYQEICSQVKACFIDGTFSPSLLKACYGEMDLFLASRLHSGIFSIGMGVPTIFIGYLSKTKGILKTLGLERYGLDLSDLKVQDLLDLLEKTWAGRGIISKEINPLVSRIVAEIPLYYCLDTFSQKRGANENCSCT